MSRKRTTTTVRRKAGGRSPTRRTRSRPQDRPTGRRFAPSLKDVTEGGAVYGGLVADRRDRIGLSQRQLAAKLRISPDTIEQIEDGHPPGAEVHQKLAAALFDRPPLLTRLLTRIDARGPMARPRLSVGPRWLWAGLAALAIVLLVLVLSSISGSGERASSSQPSLNVSRTLGTPAAIHQARMHERKLAAAKARRAAAERKREREAAAAAAAAAAVAAREAAAKQARQNAAAAPEQPVTAPVTPSPAPNTGGSGGSSTSAPELQHGIDAQGK
jgi:transcriptional regulator with XRE-family HTH domain